MKAFVFFTIMCIAASGTVCRAADLLGVWESPEFLEALGVREPSETFRDFEHLFTPSQKSIADRMRAVFNIARKFTGSSVSTGELLVTPDQIECACDYAISIIKFTPDSAPHYKEFWMRGYFIFKGLRAAPGLSQIFYTKTLPVLAQVLLDALCKESSPFFSEENKKELSEYLSKTVAELERAMLVDTYCASNVRLMVAFRRAERAAIVAIEAAAHDLLRSMSAFGAHGKP